MPRIRTLKPEHKQHRKVGMLTDREYRLWVGMITEADDEGRLVADAAWLRGVIFTYHPRVTVRQVAEALTTLQNVGLLRLYRVGDTTYAEFPSWRDHQHINRPTPSKIPPFQHSMNGHGELHEHSLRTHEGSEGSDRKGSEGSDQSHATAPAPVAPSPGSLAFEIPASIARALERAPLLGRALRDKPLWWQAQIRAHPGLDYASELLRAEAWCRSNPDRAPKRRPARFLHSWFERAARPREEA